MTRCLREAVRLEEARLLWELGQEEAAAAACDLLGEKGRELGLELRARPLVENVV